ncbi:hypothetical protein [Methylocystis hirsuta]|uniref:Uncharacterized protein n=1 Tax=Methylocystis hirsuta TaxID=369798 RepID=A0A3M9XQM7_9HYPH|nr:hypothetical protein [Methylocystis hirsuta]RNJ49408.1 hypothetical protein D1O30_07120 [Methylocystis hirsuta]
MANIVDKNGNRTSVERAVRSALDNTSWGLGQMEGLSEKIENLQNVVAKLVDEGVSDQRINNAALRDILGYGADFERVE